MGVLDVVHDLFITANLRFSRLVYNVCISRRTERYFKSGRHLPSQHYQDSPVA